MKKLVVIEHISLDGVIQGPGAPEEDTSGGFRHGGWIMSSSDPVLGGHLRRRMESEFDLLLGRTTFEIWEPYWPHNPGWPQANRATKYVASRTRNESPWQPTVFLGGDLVSEVTRLKREPGPNLHVWGSANLVQSLLAADLVDELSLFVYPLTLGTGKRLFGPGTGLQSYRVIEGTVTPSGVFVVTYGRGEPDQA